MRPSAAALNTPDDYDNSQPPIAAQCYRELWETPVSSHGIIA